MNVPTPIESTWSLVALPILRHIAANELETINVAELTAAINEATNETLHNDAIHAELKRLIDAGWIQTEAVVHRLGSTVPIVFGPWLTEPAARAVGVWPPA